MHKKVKAFTVAELVITMLIFGVSSLMFMNLSLKKYSNTDTNTNLYSVGSLKKAHSYANRMKGIEQVITIVPSNVITGYDQSKSYKLKISRVGDYSCDQPTTGTKTEISIVRRDETTTLSDDTKTTTCKYSIIYTDTDGNINSESGGDVFAEIDNCIVVTSTTSSSPPTATTEDKRKSIIEYGLRPYMSTYPQLSQIVDNIADLSKLENNQKITIKEGAAYCNLDTSGTDLVDDIELTGDKKINISVFKTDMLNQKELE